MSYFEEALTFEDEMDTLVEMMEVEEECNDSGKSGKKVMMEEDPKDDDKDEDVEESMTPEELDDMWISNYGFYAEGVELEEDPEEGALKTIPVNRGHEECPDAFQKSRAAAYAAGPTNNEVEAILSDNLGNRFDTDNYDSHTVPNVGILGTTMDEVDPELDFSDDDPEDDGMYDYSEKEIEEYED